MKSDRSLFLNENNFIKPGVIQDLDFNFSLYMLIFFK